MEKKHAFYLLFYFHIQTNILWETLPDWNTYRSYGTAVSVSFCSSSKYADRSIGLLKYEFRCWLCPAATSVTQRSVMHTCSASHGQQPCPLVVLFFD
jgi:hypothetical protein